MAPFTPPDPIHSTEEYWTGLVFFSRWYIYIRRGLVAVSFLQLATYFNYLTLPDADPMQMNSTMQTVQLSCVRFGYVGSDGVNRALIVTTYTASNHEMMVTDTDTTPLALNG